MPWFAKADTPLILHNIGIAILHLSYFVSYLFYIPVDISIRMCMEFTTSIEWVTISINPG